jgi:hypothetical protein
MKEIKIDLAEPFPSVLAQALSLPLNGTDAPKSESEVKKAARCLYEAAHGRVVDTNIGPVGIAPAVAAALKTAPFSMKTREEFLVFAEANSSFKRSAATFLNRRRAEPDGGK